MKTALITGSSRGIGSEIALTFAKAGYNVVVNYNQSKDAALALLTKLREITPAIAVKADVSNALEINEMADLAFKAFGKVDVLVNNAGISLNKMLVDTTEDEWDRLIGVNIKGMFNATKALLPRMTERGFGRVINISSVWGVSGGSCETVYSATKGAAIAFTKALAKEVGGAGVTVNCIAPGVIDTDMNGLFTEEEKRTLIDRTLLNRLGTPLDVANAALFLAEQDFITGQVLTVDGGFN